MRGFPFPKLLANFQLVNCKRLSALCTILMQFSYDIFSILKIEILNSPSF